FGSFTPRLRDLAARAFRERWIDAGPRPGKRGGGFCMRIGDGASRILMNFDGSFDSAQTLAHELGHAYHNLCLAPRRTLLRPTPMALAETASIFCETIMVQSGLEAADDRERLALLNVDLAGATQVVVDIHSRFEFESELYRRRADGPLSVDELCGAMTAAQAATYGDGVDAATYHPWMWAVKPHYYDVHLHFYNWPYCFGLLFGIGLYARYVADPDAFRGDYDDLLSSTGMLDAQPLAARFGIDLTDPGFWRSSLDVIRERIDTFCALAGAA
ncbi:MAG: M3 family metallopeptidase, partial [Solirubrobacteraceae bacterium]